jgi:2-polyprenyl-3-methyl-5-hydroxy-6-metoxy-1,4-benzoquinol methylase
VVKQKQDINEDRMICDHKKGIKSYQFYGLPIYRCRDCNIIFTEKYGKDMDVKGIYQDYYRNEISGRFCSWIEYIIRTFRFFRALKIFTIYPQAKSILDVGSGRGFMLYYLKKYYGYQRAAGTQISENAYEFSKNRLHLEIYNKDLLELFQNKDTFDIITLWHVLEHVTQPEKYIEKIYSLLDRRGKLIIEVPNFSSWTRRFTGKYWLGLDINYHITFFTPESLSNILKKHGFKVNAIHTFSLEYSTFLSAQSFVSLFTRSNHLFFQYLQNGNFSLRLIPHIFLFVLINPVCFLINILLYFSKCGEVLLVTSEKD